MSTRCVIGRLNKDGTVSAVYCHHDGYPGWVGKILYEHYSQEEKLNELLQRGDMSSLMPNIDECDFYEDNDGPTVYENIEEFRVKGDDHDYHYFFDNGEWYVIKMHWDSKNNRMSGDDEAFQVEELL